MNALTYDATPLELAAEHYRNAARWISTTKFRGDEAMDAAETMRRAEWRLAHAIAAADNLAPHGMTRTAAPPGTVFVGDYVAIGEWRGGARGGVKDYRNVTAAQLDEALSKARQERNLSRANVMRHLGVNRDGLNGDRTPPDDPRDAHPVTMRPDKRSKFNYGAKRLDPARIVEEAAVTLDAVRSSLDLIAGGHALDLVAEQRAEWVRRMRTSLRLIAQYVNTELVDNGR